VSITITAVNDAPVAANDSYTTNEDTALTGNVLTNDTDVDGDALTAAVVSTTAHGTLALSPTGAFTYTPAANYNGSDSFSYKANDTALDSNVATVTITITPVNDPPVAVDDAFTTNEDTPLSGNVLTNDTDVDAGTTLNAVLVATTTHGTLTLAANGGFTYTPAANYNGTDSFTYKANDGARDSNDATVAITVAAVNDPPVATDDALTTNEDTPLAGNVLTNDTDVDAGTTLTAAVVATTTHGTLTLTPAGAFTYTPAANYNGSDSFTYKANDGT